MKILGYIVSKGVVKYNNCFIKKVNDISLVDKEKPYLVCGLSEAREIASDNFSILNKRIGEYGYWTFARTEKRDEHEVDVNNFCRMVMSKYISEIHYVYLNIMNINIDVAKRAIRFINSSIEKYIYIWNDMLYISCPNNISLGFSLKICEYCGIKRQKILDVVSSNKSNIFIDDDKQIPKNIIPYIKNKTYSVPFIMQMMK